MAGGRSVWGNIANVKRCQVPLKGVKYEWRCHRVFASFSQIRRAVVLDATQDSFLLAAAPC